jgi:hypothetical protein
LKVAMPSRLRLLPVSVRSNSGIAQVGVRAGPRRGGGLSPGTSFSPDGTYAHVLEAGDGCNLGDLGLINLTAAALRACKTPTLRPSPC